MLRATHLLKPIVDKMFVLGFIQGLLAAFGLFYTIQFPNILQEISGVTPPLLEHFPDVVDVSRTVTTDDDFMDPVNDYGDSGYTDTNHYSSFIGNTVVDCFDYYTVLAVFSTFLAGVLLLLLLLFVVLFCRQMKALRRQKKSMEDVLQELRMKIRENDSLMTDHKLVQEELSHLRLELASSKQTTADLQDKLAHRNQVLKNLHSVIQDRKAEIKKNDTEKKLLKYLQGVESQRQQLKDQNEKLQVDKANLEEVVENLRIQLDLHTKEVANFKEKLEAKDEDMKNHLQQIEEGSSKLNVATQTSTSLPSRQEEAQPTSDRITRGRHERIAPPSPERITRGRHGRIEPPSPERTTQGVHERIGHPSPQRITRDRQGRIVPPNSKRIPRGRHEPILPP